MALCYYTLPSSVLATMPVAAIDTSIATAAAERPHSVEFAACPLPCRHAAPARRHHRRRFLLLCASRVAMPLIRINNMIEL